MPWILRDLPQPLWSNLQERARREGWPLKALILQLAQDYVDGKIAPTTKPPVEMQLVVIPQTCGGCHRPIEVLIRHSKGFSIMQHREAQCPVCGTKNRFLLPGDVVDVVEPGGSTS